MNYSFIHIFEGGARKYKAEMKRPPKCYIEKISDYETRAPLRDWKRTGRIKLMGERLRPLLPQSRVHYYHP